MYLIKKKSQTSNIEKLSYDEFESYLDTLENAEQFQHVLEELYSIKDKYKVKEEKSRVLRISHSIARDGLSDPEFFPFELIPTACGFMIGYSLSSLYKNYYFSAPPNIYLIGGAIGAASFYAIVKSYEKCLMYKCKKHIQKKHDLFVKMKLTDDKIVELNNNSTNHNSNQYNYEKE